MFVPLFIPAAECEVWKQFKQLADAECFSALRGGNGALEWWKNSSDWTHTGSFLSEVCLAVGGKVNSCFQAAVTASLILFVVHHDPHPVSSLCFVLFQWNQEFFWLLRCWFFFCFLWKDTVEMLRGSTRECWLTWAKQTCIAITFFDYLDDDFGGFSSPLRDCDCMLPCIGLRSQIKWILWGFHVYGYCIY